MIERLQAILALARTSAKDGLRSPAAGIVIAAGAALTMLSPELAIFTLGNASGFVLDLGASTVLLAMLFLAATTGALGTAERVQDGTATLVLQKATSPLDYVLGAWLGTATVLVAGGWILLLAVVHATLPRIPNGGWIDLAALAAAVAWGVRASRARRSFQVATLAALAATGTVAIFARVALGGATPVVLVAIAATALAVLAGLAYAAVGVLAGVRLPPAVAASATLAAAVLGAALQGLEAGLEAGAGARADASLIARAAGVAAWLVPDLGLFSMGDAGYLGDDAVVPLAYVAGVATWSLLYAAFALGAAALLLERREAA